MWVQFLPGAQSKQIVLLAIGIERRSVSALGGREAAARPLRAMASSESEPIPTGGTYNYEHGK